MWDNLDRSLRAEPCQPTSAEALLAMVQALWQKTAAETTCILAASSPRRIAEAIKKQTGPRLSIDNVLFKLLY